MSLRIAVGLAYLFVAICFLAVGGYSLYQPYVASKKLIDGTGIIRNFVTFEVGEGEEDFPADTIRYAVEITSPEEYRGTFVYSQKYFLKDNPYHPGDKVALGLRSAKNDSAHIEEVFLPSAGIQARFVSRRGYLVLAVGLFFLAVAIRKLSG